MSKFITVATYDASNPRVLLLRSRLESEGIRCFIKNEFVVYAKGSRPPELQVMESDMEMALPILEEMGFYIHREEEQHYNSFFQKFDSKTRDFPFLKNLKLEMRLMILTILIVGTISTVCYFALQPSINEILVDYQWCVKKVIYKGQTIPVSSTGIVLVYNNGCREVIDFYKDGNISMPGINNQATHGQWLYYKNEITISGIGENGEIYNGDYNMKINNDNSVTLQSVNTIIYIEPFTLFNYRPDF